MNLAENRFEKERKEALDSMGLTKKNRRLADQWMDMEQEENPELLKLMILQGFNGNRTNTWACASYFRCLKKNGRTKEAGRFVRMAAVVGGGCQRTGSGHSWENLFRRHLQTETIQDGKTV